MYSLRRALRAEPERVKTFVRPLLLTTTSLDVSDPGRGAPSTKSRKSNSRFGELKKGVYWKPLENPRASREISELRRGSIERV